MQGVPDRTLGRTACAAALAVAAAALAACGGGDSATFNPGGGPPPYSAVPQVQVSQPTMYPAGCDGVAAEGTLFPDSAIEPYVVAFASNNSFLIASWQQNRWSGGGAQAIAIATSADAGTTWVTANAPAFSRCAGGNSGNAGDYARASNAWLTTSPNGSAYALALAFTGDLFATGSTSAMLVSRSNDAGANWTLPVALIQDGSAFFNDKGSITADPTNASYVYAVWDRLNNQANTGPAYLSLTANGNSTWSAPRPIYDPGTNNQTINNIVVVTPDGTLIDLFNEIDDVTGMSSSHLKAIRSTDHGTTWSPPVPVADMEGVGTSDPNSTSGVRDSVILFSAAVAPAPSGAIYVVWQDARFSAGAYDGIAMSVSLDDGLTWTDPVEVNGDPSVAAFTPTVATSPLDTVAVTYYDLRNAHYSKTQLLADAWIVTSPDAATFTEAHLSGPFDLQRAPLTTPYGYFLGDYEGLVFSGNQFEPVYAQTNPGTMSVNAVVYAAFPPPATAAATAARLHSYRAQPALGAAPLSAAVRSRMAQRIHAALARRRPN